jgi:acyl carrier protein
MTRIEFQHAVEDILKVPRGSLKESDSRETVETWSSFSDVEIVEFIESKFGVEPEADLMEAETFGDILKNLENKQVFAP